MGWNIHSGANEVPKIMLEYVCTSSHGINGKEGSCKHSISYRTVILK